MTTTDRRRFSRAVSRLLSARAPDAHGPATVGGIMADRQVKQMFETTASTYDLQNRLLSLWRDRHWREIFVRYLNPEPGGLIGDFAVGTADIAIATCRRYSSVRVIGVDFTPGMLRIARRKIRDRGLDDRIHLQVGDLRAIPIENDRLDGISMSFGIRNIAERDQVLRECHRVLKPGGRVQIMEMALPHSPVLGTLYRWYIDHVMPVVGNVFSGTDYAYDYLRHSVHRFPSAEGFCREMSEAGLVDTQAISITFDTARIYRGRKPEKSADGRVG